MTPTDREAVLIANGVALEIVASIATSVALGSTLLVDADSGDATNRETAKGYCHGTASNLQKQLPEVPSLFNNPLKTSECQPTSG